MEDTMTSPCDKDIGFIIRFIRVNTDDPLAQCVSVQTDSINQRVVNRVLTDSEIFN